MLKEKYEKSYLKQEQRIKSEIEQKADVQRDKYFLFKSVMPPEFEDHIILDVGGGAGALATQVTKAKSDVEYITIDISITALKLARLLLKKLAVYDKADLILADANKLPIKSGSVNVAILTDVVEHVIEPQNILVEANKALNRCGYIFVTVPYAFGPETILMDDTLRIAYALKMKRELPTHLAFFTENRLKDLLTSSGFMHVESKFYSASYLLFVFGNMLPFLRGSLEKTVFRWSCLAICGKASK